MSYGFKYWVEGQRIVLYLQADTMDNTIILVGPVHYFQAVTRDNAVV